MAASSKFLGFMVRLGTVEEIKEKRLREEAELKKRISLLKIGYQFTLMKSFLSMLPRKHSFYLLSSTREAS